MKHLKQVVQVAFLLTVTLLLNACARTEQTDYQFFDPTGRDTRLSFFYQGDKVIKQTTDNVLTYDYLGYENAEEAEEHFSQVYNTKIYEDLEGVTQSMEYQEDRIVEHLEIDYSKAKLTEVYSIIGISKEEAKSANHISLSVTIKMLDEQQFDKITDGEFQEIPDIEQTDFQIIDASGRDSRLTYYSRGDKVLKQTSSTVLTYKLLGFSNSEEARREFPKAFGKSLYDGIVGVKQTLEYTDDRIIEQHEIDYSKANLLEIYPIIGLSKEEVLDLDYISLEDTRKQLLENRDFQEIKDGKFQDLP